MNSFDVMESSSPRPVLKWLPPVGGLLTAAVVAFVVCRLPLVNTLSWGELISSAAECVVAVFLANAVSVWGLFAIQQETSGLAVWRLVLRTSLDAVWLAPLAFFIRENSAWAMAIAAVFVSSAAKSFHLFQDGRERGDSSQWPAVCLTGGEFRIPESSPWFWRQVWAAVAALCAQAGALAGFGGYPFTGATLIGISSAVWTWSFFSYGALDRAQSRASSQSNSRIFLAVAMAVVFTMGALIRYLPNTYRVGGFGVPSRKHSSHALAQGDQDGKPVEDQASNSGGRHEQRRDEKGSEDGERAAPPIGEEASDGLVAAARDANAGVILWPKKQTYTKLVAPAPAMGNTLQKSNRHANPLTIPFNGVYWFFKAPDLNPPRTSREMQGSPELLDIHSTDRRPLSMEAHENLGSLLDLDCCSGIQIVIRNADVYEETVSLELVLINSSLPGKPSQSLGRMMVKSKRPWRLYEKPAPISETLNFPIPPKHSIRRFDEVMIVFRLDAFRADDGAKIAIDRFVLVPRGL
jgi:hypothetical protein